MGFELVGMFCGDESREFKNEDGSVDVRHFVNLATGNLAYRVYLADNEIDNFSSLNLGDLVRVSCRVYVGKNGKLSVIEGKLIA